MGWRQLPENLHALIGSDQGSLLWWQMSIRGVLVLLFGLVMIRLFGRNAFGKQTPLDIVLAIVIGSNLSRTITGNSPFAATLGATAVLVLCFWILDHVAARWPGFSRLVKGNPIPLMRDGQLDRKQMRQVGISEGDIEEAARLSGLSGICDLRQAMLERSGKISPVRRDRGREP